MSTSSWMAIADPWHAMKVSRMLSPQMKNISIIISTHNITTSDNLVESLLNSVNIGPKNLKLTKAFYFINIKLEAYQLRTFLIVKSQCCSCQGIHTVMNWKVPLLTFLYTMKSKDKKICQHEALKRIGLQRF